RTYHGEPVSHAGDKRARRICAKRVGAVKLGRREGAGILLLEDPRPQRSRIIKLDEATLAGHTGVDHPEGKTIDRCPGGSGDGHTPAVVSSYGIRAAGTVYGNICFDRTAAVNVFYPPGSGDVSRPGGIEHAAQRHRPV